ncbi:MAG: sporulation protein YqfD [Clostridia bacterium]|nr:sporulation protein YqfD [Clostridia bacterium]
MRLYRWFSLIKGYFVIEARGRCERALNAAKARNIRVWDAVKTGSDTVVFRTDLSGFKKLRQLSLPVEITASERRGLPFFLEKHRKRVGFLIGTALFFALIAFCSSFVWDINIYGLETISESELSAALAKEGVEIGAPLSKINKPYAELAMHIACPKIKWIQIETVGTTVNVYLKESTAPPETALKEDEITDVVAAKDGVIILAVPHCGIPCVKAGQTVQKGDLLIAGRYMSYQNEELNVHAYGRVMAKTVNVIETQVPLKEEVLEKTGEVMRKNSIRIFSWEIRFYSDTEEIPFKSYLCEKEKKQLELFGIKLPVFLYSTAFYETAPQTVEISEEIALLRAENVANKLQFSQFGGIIVNDIETSYKISNGVLYYECYLYCTEDIAKLVPADMERPLKEHDFWS